MTDWHRLIDEIIKDQEARESLKRIIDQAQAEAVEEALRLRRN